MTDFGAGEDADQQIDRNVSRPWCWALGKWQCRHLEVPAAWWRGGLYRWSCAHVINNACVSVSSSSGAVGSRGALLAGMRGCSFPRRDSSARSAWILRDRRKKRKTWWSRAQGAWLHSGSSSCGSAEGGCIACTVSQSPLTLHGLNHRKARACKSHIRPEARAVETDWRTPESESGSRAGDEGPATRDQSRHF